MEKEELSGKMREWVRLITLLHASHPRTCNNHNNNNKCTKRLFTLLGSGPPVYA